MLYYLEAIHIPTKKKVAIKIINFDNIKSITAKKKFKK